VYNPSIGKFLSVDPLAPDYPELTVYQFASNRPIDGVDLDGLEYVLYLYSPDVSAKFSNTMIFETNSKNDIYRQREITYWSLTHHAESNYLSKFVDSHDSENWDKHSVATLENDPDNFPEGVTVILYKWDFKKGDTETHLGISEYERYHISPNSEYGSTRPSDVFYPVDVGLLSSMYDEHDFMGTYTSTSYGLFYGQAEGQIQGHLKGFGYVEFSFEEKLAMFGGGGGKDKGEITGSYTGYNVGTAYNLSGNGSALGTDTPIGEFFFWKGNGQGPGGVNWKGTQSALIGFGIFDWTPIIGSKSNSTLTFPAPSNEPVEEPGWEKNLIKKE
jgi:hypothetical protein